MSFGHDYANSCTCNMTFPSQSQWVHHESCSKFGGSVDPKMEAERRRVMSDFDEVKQKEHEANQRKLAEFVKEIRERGLEAPSVQGGGAHGPAMPKPEALIGIGGGPTRATTLPTDSKLRKQYPIASGFFDYFPDAIAAIAHLSWVGNEQHNPGQPLHWARDKSTGEADTLLRHFAQRGTIDTDKIRHSTKVAWRALALLQKELEEAQKEAA